MEDNYYNNSLHNLCSAMLLLETKNEMCSFLRDLCTPKELSAIAERWRVCKLLGHDNLSYREISHITGASLTTISRVARFLKDEPYHGYLTLLNKLKKIKKE
ncbi:Transcriptional regulator [Candidatus Xenohaliotis californiensis]|uniref:Transcriptional regulator n=1 Tax=Candidatus Xenohaliotis californiensis TaxID=84677 RepID=A0ABP0ERS2_9RICK|nr:Transcriptional regulator [Candidatus Xenohaliotis californiensis]